MPEVGAVCTLKEALEQTKQMDLKLIPYELSEGMMRTRKLIESAAALHAKHIQTEAQQLMENERLCFSVLSDYARVLRDWKVQYALAMQSGFMPVTLGKRILRTETAGLTVMAWLMYQLEDSGIS